MNWKKINSVKLKNQDNDDETEEDEKNVTKLHHILRPYLLRRLKEDLNLKLPGKREIFIYTGLTAMQRKYYDWIINKNTAQLSKMNLMNIFMQLRKCCNHPYLFDNAEPLIDGEYQLGHHIIDNSAKMLILEKLLEKLKEKKGKILIFSQMTRMLDILQDFLTYKGYNYERLDGSCRSEERFLFPPSFSLFFTVS